MICDRKLARHTIVSGIAPGRCVVLPIGPAWVLSDYPFGSVAKTVLIAEGETIDRIDFALIRGGVITGKVTDAVDQDSA